MNDRNVIYDTRIPKIKPPKKSKINKRFVFLLALFFSIILTIVYIQSPLSKLSQVSINGNILLSEEQVLQYAGIEPGMPYFNIQSGKIEDALKEATEVKQANVTRKIPNQLEINITEHNVVAFWLEDDQLYPILVTGDVLMHHSNLPGGIQGPILNEWPHKEGLIELSKELNNVPYSVSQKISEIRLTPIVSDPYRLTLYMVDGHEVKTSIRKFAENMSWYNHFAEQAQQAGKTDGIFYLLEGKWYEDPHATEQTISD